MKRTYIALAIICALLLFLPASAQSPDTIVALPPGASVVVTCGGTIGGAQVDSKTLRITCPQLVPTVTSTPTPTRTPAPATATPTPMAHDAADLTWHAPGSHGDRPAHEHGNQPPAWLTDAGITPSFTHVAGTPNENMAYFKHTSFKAVSARMDGVDFYFVGHWDFNPSGHPSRFHSYQIWLRDATGAISHMHGWQDYGEDNNTGPNLVEVCGVSSNIRPIMMANKVGCSPIMFETWYSRASGSGAWSIDTGVSINPNYFAGGDITDPTTWTPTGGVRNLTRRLEIAWYANRSPLKGTFYTTQWGDEVEGPNDPLCDGLHTRTFGTRSYNIICLEQYIAPTLTSITFPDNAIQRVYPGSSVVRLPN